MRTIMSLWELMKKKISPKIYLIGHCGPEHNYVIKATFSYKKALKIFQGIRLDLLSEAEHYYNSRHIQEKDMYEEMIRKLSETDPEKICNYPHDTPYIHEIRVLL